MLTRFIPLAIAACALVAGCTTMHPRVERSCEKTRLRRQQGVHGDRHRELPALPGLRRVGRLRPRVRRRQEQADRTFAGSSSAKRACEFAANGIAFDSSVFQCSPESEGKDKFVCKDAHPDFGIFKYSVNVTVKDSLFGPRGVQSLDPWVVNY